MTKETTESLNVASVENLGSYNPYQEYGIEDALLQRPEPTEDLWDTQEPPGEVPDSGVPYRGYSAEYVLGLREGFRDAMSCVTAQFTETLLTVVRQQTSTKPEPIKEPEFGDEPTTDSVDDSELPEEPVIPEGTDEPLILQEMYVMPPPPPPPVEEEIEDDDLILEGWELDDAN